MIDLLYILHTSQWILLIHIFKSEHAFDKIFDKIRIEKTLSCKIVMIIEIYISINSIKDIVYIFVKEVVFHYDNA